MANNNRNAEFDKPSRIELPSEVRPVLKHVQPSGRGMQSEHEMLAKRAAVESIERRFDHNERVRKKAARKRAAANFGSVVAGLAVLAGIAYYFTHRGEELTLPGADFGEMKNAVCQCLPAFVNPEKRAYEDAVAEFAKGELAHWRDAPKELKPKTAPAGTVYHALVPQGGKFGLYELKASGEAIALSPSGPSAPMTMKEFNKARNGRSYLIACGGRVFVVGDGDLKTMDELRKALLPQDR